MKAKIKDIYDESKQNYGAPKITKVLRKSGEVIYELIKLSYWDTPEEAFEEYKRIKQADILVVAAKYKSKIPKRFMMHCLRLR